MRTTVLLLLARILRLLTAVLRLLSILGLLRLRRDVGAVGTVRGVCKDVARARVHDHRVLLLRLLLR
jgi:hypothetical protein